MVVNKDKNKQILITIPLDMLAEIETFWRNDENFKNRNEGIRFLIQSGIDTVKVNNENEKN